MLTQFSRTQLIFGRENMKKLSASRVAVFGIGGVGSYTVEALARGGIGALDIIDNDRVCLTNINRQLYALHSTIGKYKVDVAEERIRDINPDCSVTPYKLFFMPETAGQFDFSVYDYVVDCIDTVTGKLQLIAQSKQSEVPVISCMGAGNKTDPTQFEVADISKTSVCPLARVMRRELRNRGIEHVKVVYSKENVLTPVEDEDADGKQDGACSSDTVQNGAVRNQVPGSTSFVPSVAGLIIAGEVIKDIIGFSLSGGR